MRRLARRGLGRNDESPNSETKGTDGLRAKLERFLTFRVYGATAKNLEILAHSFNVVNVNAGRPYREGMIFRPEWAVVRVLLSTSVPTTAKKRPEYHRGTIGAACKNRYHSVIAQDEALSICMKLIRILLCNHHPLVRSGLRVLLDRDSELRIIAEAADGREALSLAEHVRPDVILLDVKLPHVNGITIARKLCSRSAKEGILFVSVYSDEEYVSEAFKAGARGYVLADAVQSDLIPAVRVVAKGNSFLSPAITSKLLNEYARKQDPQRESLSEYEKRLFCLIAQGLDDYQIAQHFNRSLDELRSDWDRLKTALSRLGVPELIRHSFTAVVTQQSA